MYFIWFLAAAGGVLLWILVKPFVFAPAEKRVLSPFHPSRPVPDLSGNPDRESQARTQAGLLKLADQGTSDPLHSPRNVRQSLHASGVQQAAMSDSGGSSSDSSSVATIPFSGVCGQNRISTWGNRRLFSQLRGLLTDDGSSIPLPTPEELPIRNDDFVFGSITPSVAQLLPESAARRETQRKNLAGAGYHSRASWLNLMAIRFVLAFLALVVVGFWLIVAPPVLEPWLLALLVMAPLFMWALPPLIVAYRASERKIDIERGLPDVLDMMNMGISQGLTVPQSLQRISREIGAGHPALAEELHIVNHQAAVGSMSHALKNFSQRIDSPEVNSFTSLLIQSESTGSSISRALSEYSDSIRASLKERADARANAASFKLLFPVALLLMPSVFLFLLGPAIVQMSNFFSNQGRELQQNRQDAIRSLDQQPQLDNRLGGQFNPGP